jgi:hypothetical protein
MGAIIKNEEKPNTCILSFQIVFYIWGRFIESMMMAMMMMI